MKFLVFLLALISHRAEASQSPDDKMLLQTARNITFQASYTTNMAIQDIQLWLENMCWNGIVGVENSSTTSSTSLLESFEEVTEYLWWSICDKAFGRNVVKKGILDLTYINLLSKFSLCNAGGGPLMEGGGLVHPLTQQLNWLLKCLRSPNNAAIFWSGINWSFGSTSLLAEGMLKSSDDIERITQHQPIPHTELASLYYHMAQFTQGHYLRVKTEINLILESVVQKGCPFACYQNFLAQSERSSKEKRQKESLLRRSLRGHIAGAYFYLAERIKSHQTNTDEFDQVIFDINDRTPIIGRLYTKAAQMGECESLNALAKLIEKNKWNHDEYNHTILDENQRTLVAERIYLKAGRVGNMPALYSFARRIWDSTYSSDEYGTLIESDEQRRQVVGEKVTEIVNTAPWIGEATCFLGYLIYLKEWHYDTRSQLIDNDHQRCSVAADLYIHAAQNGNCEALCNLGVLVWKKETNKARNGKNIREEQRPEVTLSLFDDSKSNEGNINYILIKSLCSKELSKHEKGKIYQQLSDRLSDISEASDKTYISAYMAYHLETPNCEELMLKAIETGNEQAVILYNEWQEKQAKEAVKVAMVEPVEDSESDMDSEDSHSETLTAQPAEVKKTNEKSEEEPLSRVSRKTKNELKKIKKKEDMEVILDRLNKRKKKIQEDPIPSEKDNKTIINWSKEARDGLETLLRGYHNQLTILLEALKDVEYPRSLIRTLKSERAGDNQTVYYGNLSKGNRLECTRTIENGSVTKILVLGLTGHHTASLGNGDKRR